MNETTEMTPGPQRLQALARANEVRLARAELKRKVAQGDVSAAKVILECPPGAGSWSVGDLLRSQRRWGTTRCRKFLSRNGISEIKQIGTLTDRQRRLLAAALREHECSLGEHPVPTPALQPIAPVLSHQRELELVPA
jgi:hypothetical protein